jgi:hypothetical protein
MYVSKMKQQPHAIMDFIHFGKQQNEIDGKQRTG